MHLFFDRLSCVETVWPDKLSMLRARKDQIEVCICVLLKHCRIKMTVMGLSFVNCWQVENCSNMPFIQTYVLSLRDLLHSCHCGSRSRLFTGWILPQHLHRDSFDVSLWPMAECTQYNRMFCVQYQHFEKNQSKGQVSKF